MTRNAGKTVLGRMSIKPQWKTAFLTVLLVGLLVHLPMMVRDIPNHDGLASLYFDQNMITSGRFFLGIACSFSSFYALPWISGLLGLFWLALTSVALVAFLEIHRKFYAGLIGAILVTFPVIASNFAYVFTMDGYMMGLCLAVSSVLAVKKLRYGAFVGGCCLALSLGIYQSYLSVAMVLSLYGIVQAAIIIERASKQGTHLWEKTLFAYIRMGIYGVLFYLGILHLLLWIQGKELASYQGISDFGVAESGGNLNIFLRMGKDFLSFTFRGGILLPNIAAQIALTLLFFFAATVFLRRFLRNRWSRKPQFYVAVVLTLFLTPICFNAILLISPKVTYHSLMRYQWVLIPILLLAFIERFGGIPFRKYYSGIVSICVIVLILTYSVIDNIGYSNLEKRLDKTYAYCIRLLDRIEQTPGYYQGIPIAMVGVVGEEQFPPTDLTRAVTEPMLGMSGDSLLYTAVNYQAFIKHYLGADLNFLPTEEMMRVYYTDEYIKMESFPGKTSVQVIDGILYVKTENTNRSE
jgi:hypothetical protein